ncbi:MAG: hypothetical protein FWC12_05755 [Treponema sp.]|nr:hypothetical protein [Treponema sp.]
MQCKNCNSKWETNENVSITKCPFCGKDLPEQEEPKSYDNVKDALAAIKKRFGEDVLLGKLNALFPDLAPSVSQADKELVYTVFKLGAAKVLKNNLNASVENKEAAVKSAIQKLTESYIAENMAVKIIYEFIYALGWNIKKYESKQDAGNNQQANASYKGTLSGVDFDGDAYEFEGDIVNGLMHGKGVWRYKNGDFFEGYFVNGVRSGKGKYIWAVGGVYEGDFVNDRRTGKGKIKWANGDVYEGDFLNGKRHGKGKYIWADGTIREGNWIDNEYQENFAKNSYRGTLSGVDHDGDAYEFEGDIVNGLMHGKGVWRYKKGDFFEGNFVNGLRSGKGKYIWADGGVYEGDYANDRRNGKGKYIFPWGDVYEGDWVNNQMTGRGRYIEDGIILEGNFLNGNYQGK